MATNKKLLNVKVETKRKKNLNERNYLILKEKIIYDLLINPLREHEAKKLLFDILLTNLPNKKLDETIKLILSNLTFPSVP